LYNLIKSIQNVASKKPFQGKNPRRKPDSISTYLAEHKPRRPNAPPRLCIDLLCVCILLLYLYA
jgi:hypothetical protein